MIISFFMTLTATTAYASDYIVSGIWKAQFPNGEVVARYVEHMEISKTGWEPYSDGIAIHETADINSKIKFIGIIDSNNKVVIYTSKASNLSVAKYVAGDDGKIESFEVNPLYYDKSKNKLGNGAAANVATYHLID